MLEAHRGFARETPQYLVVEAGFAGGVVGAAIFAASRMDLMALLGDALLFAASCALAACTIGMFLGTIVGLSIQLLIRSATAPSRSWPVAVATGFVGWLAFALGEGVKQAP